MRHPTCGTPSSACSTIVGIAAAHLVAALTVPAASPVLAVGSTVIDLTPTPMKEWAIRQFGTADKPILVGSVLVGRLLLAALAGVMARRLTRTAGLLIVVGWSPVRPPGRPVPAPLDILPALVAAVVGATSLWWLCLDDQAPTADPGWRVRLERRGVLAAGGSQRPQ